MGSRDVFYELPFHEILKNHSKLLFFSFNVSVSQKDLETLNRFMTWFLVKICCANNFVRNELEIAKMSTFPKHSLTFYQSFQSWYQNHAEKDSRWILIKMEKALKLRVLAQTNYAISNYSFSFYISLCLLHGMKTHRLFILECFSCGFCSFHHLLAKFIIKEIKSDRKSWKGRI